MGGLVPESKTRFHQHKVNPVSLLTDTNKNSAAGLTEKLNACFR